MSCDGRGMAVQLEAVLEEFDEYLELQRGRSEHTRRAYLGDLRSLFAFLSERAPDPSLAGLTVPLLRSWLAAREISLRMRSSRPSGIR